MGSLRGPFVGLLVLALSMVARPAAAVDEATRSVIREISAEGVAAYQSGDYELARQKLDQAFSMLPTAPLGLWSARTLEKLGLLVEARERYLAAERARLDSAGDRDLQKKARAEAQSERERLEARIPKVVVRVRVEGETGSLTEMTLTVAGKKLPGAFVGTAIPVNPGTIEISVTAQGESARVALDIEAGQRKEVTLVLTPGAAGSDAPLTEPTTPDEPAESGAAPVQDEPEAAHGKGSWHPIAGWIGVGMGVASLAVGAVGSVLVYDKLDSLGCGASGCPPGTDQDEMASGNSLRTLSTVGYVAGGVLLATGVTLLLTAPKRERQMALQARPGGAALVFSGTF